LRVLRSIADGLGVCVARSVTVAVTVAVAEGGLPAVLSRPPPPPPMAAAMVAMTMSRAKSPTMPRHPNVRTRFTTPSVPPMVLRWEVRLHVTPSGG
jgi:hypothetical protein